MRKHFIFFALLICLYFAPNLYAEELTNTGFIPGQIWYSAEPLTEGNTVKIYTAVWNNTSSPLSAKVEFYDQNVVLGTRDIIVPSLQLKEVSVSWKVTSGDHSISAKIISPSITASGKKKAILLNRNTTVSDKKFISVVLNTVEGTPATSSDIIKSQIDKATSSLDGIVPESISAPVSKNVSIIDVFRTNTFKNISQTKVDAEKKIDEYSKTYSSATGKVSTNGGNTQTKIGIDDATDRPITYLKLFFFTVLSFIFGSKLVFYSLIVIALFFIIRGIYRKIRNR